MRTAASLVMLLLLCTPSRAIWSTERIEYRTVGVVLSMKLTIARSGDSYIATTEVDRDSLVPIEAWALRGRLKSVVKRVELDDAKHLFRYAHLAVRSKDEPPRDAGLRGFVCPPRSPKQLAFHCGGQSIDVTLRPQAMLISSIMDLYYDMDLCTKLEHEMVEAASNPPGGKHPDSLRQAYEQFRRSDDRAQKRRIIDRLLGE